VQSIAQVAGQLQITFGELTEEAASEAPVVYRKRKFTTATLAQTFVFGFLAYPRASDEELARTAAIFGAMVTVQAVEQRFTPQLEKFLRALFRRATRRVVRSHKAAAPILKRFPGVYLLDSTTTALPDELAGEFPGCGGSHGGGKAALKIQTLWDLNSGTLETAFEAGRACDNKTSFQGKLLARGSLRISDLGYFDTEVFEQMGRAGIYWLSRLQFGTSVFTPEGQSLRPLDWLAQQPGTFIDQRVGIGAERKVACRLIAWRLPEEQANRRRQKLITETKSKNGRTPSAERLAWCDWTVLVTNVPEELLTAPEAAILYRSRWQIELLFKRWKSLGLIAELAGSTTVRQMIRLWARLLAVMVQNWLLLSTAWGDPRCSFAKAWKAIQHHALLLARVLGDRARLEAEIELLGQVLGKTAKQNKRKTPSTFELLNDPTKLDYSLT
jgi:hypothetical protein